MVLGYYGKTPAAPDPEIVKIALEQMKKPAFTGDPIAVLEPGIPKAKKLLEENNLPVTDENIFIIGALATKGGNKGLDFLKGNIKISVPKKDPNQPAAAPAPAAAVPVDPQKAKKYRVSASGKTMELLVESV